MTNDRLTNELLLSVHDLGASHLRVATGAVPCIQLRIRDEWLTPDGIRAAAVHHHLAQEVKLCVLEASGIDGRAPCAFGEIRLQVGLDANVPDREHTFHVFHTRTRSGELVVINAVRVVPRLADVARKAAHERAMSLVSDGEELRRAHRYADALAPLTQALDLCDDRKEPLFVFGVAMSLGDIMEALGRLDAATDFYERARDLADATCGADNVVAVAALGALARLAIDRGAPAHAFGPIARARATLFALVTEPCALLDVELQWARAASALGDPEANAMLEEVRAFGATFEVAEAEACALHELALIALKARDLDGAASLLRRALVLLPEPQPLTARMEIALAGVLAEQGNREAILPLLVRACETLAVHRPPDHPDRVKAETERLRFAKPRGPYR